MYTFISDIRNINPRPKKLNIQNLKHQITIKNPISRGIAINSEIIVLINSDYRINIYSLFTGNLIKSFPRITGWTPTKISIENDLLVCGYTNGSIKVFSIKNNSLKHLRTLDNSDYIDKIVIHKNLIVSSSGDEINVWSLNEPPGMEHIQTFVQPRIHNAVNSDIYALAVQKDKIISGGYGGDIHSWSLSKYQGGELVDSMRAHDYWVNSIAIKNNLIVSGGGEGNIKVFSFDKNTGEISKSPRSLECYNQLAISVAIQDNILISVSSDKEIKIWKLDNKPGTELVKTLSSESLGRPFAMVHGSGIPNVMIQGDRLISYDESGNINLWS